MMTDDDKIFGQFLKEQLPKAPENEWFTRRVLNRLPKRSPGYIFIKCAVAIAVAAIFVACWTAFIASFDFGAITIRSLLYLSSMTAVSVALLAYPLLQDS